MKGRAKTEGGSRRKEREMFLQRLVIHILLVTCLITAAASEASVAKPNCQDKCGDVSIPFPFGIGEGCYLGEWFDVVCTNRNTTPLFRRTNLVVREIDLAGGTLEVNFPMTFWNCSHRKTQPNMPNLEGSPFLISDRNKFVAVGCGALATISSEQYGPMGCLSACGNNSAGCVGVDCCQISIPSNLQAFDINFLNTERETEQVEVCRYAFLLSEYSLSGSVGDLSALYEVTDVPVELYWGLQADEIEVLGISAAPNDTEKIATHICDPSNLRPSQSRYNCRCAYNFDGNPYLLNGCQVFEPCFLPHTCGDGEYCANTDGIFTCKPIPKSPIRKSHVKVVFIGIGSGIGAVLLLLGSGATYKLVKKRRKIQLKRKFFKRNGGLLLQQQLSSGEVNIEKTKLFNSKELEKATDHFNTDRVLGQGGQGTVYKGMLADGKIVAIKKSKIDNERKITEFINEVVILSQINHRNIVKLLGCCLETEVPLLVYEFIPNGTLSQYIYDELEFPLTWDIRLRIATEVAGALSYLHTSASLPIYHRDIKSTNILLDGKYRAKVADFGTSRSVAIEQTHLTTRVYGTFGYLDPEYFQSSQLTDKSDVYSFGVVLVELLTGQRPISVQATEQVRGLATYFMHTIEENKLFDMVDARVMKEGKGEAIIAFAELAKRCLNLKGKRRPTMKEVAAALVDIQKSQKGSDADEANVEEVEYVTEAVDQPWDLFAASTCPAAFGDPAGSLSVELPLFSNVSH